jgi:hypothetical protein
VGRDAVSAMNTSMSRLRHRLRASQHRAEFGVPVVVCPADVIGRVVFFYEDSEIRTRGYLVTISARPGSC